VCLTGLLAIAPCILAADALRGVWIDEDAGNVAPPDYKIDEASLTVAVANQGNFSLSKPNKGFPVGKCRFEIYFGDKLLKTVPFTVGAEWQRGASAVLLTSEETDGSRSITNSRHGSSPRGVRIGSAWRM